MMTAVNLERLRALGDLMQRTMARKPEDNPNAAIPLPPPPPPPLPSPPTHEDNEAGSESEGSEEGSE
jgi:hypothetical protein